MTSNTRPQLRITHVADYVMPELGYQEYLLPKWNAMHGHKVDIVTSDRFAPVANYDDSWGPLLGSRIRGTGRYQRDGMTIHRLPCLWEFKRRPWIKGIEDVLLHIDPDIIFCHGTASPTAFRVARLSSNHDIPVVMDNHMVYAVQAQGMFGRVYYHLLRFASRLILAPTVGLFLGVEEECCEFMEQEQGLPPERIDTLRLGVDTAIFSPNRDARFRCRDKYGIPRSAEVVMQTGKLVPEKSPHWLSNAMVPVMSRRENTWLVYVGGGPPNYLETIRESLQERGHSDRLLILPFVTAGELGALFNMADIVVFPDATSLSCLEAAACERFVIMADLPTGRRREQAGIGVCYDTGNVPILTELILNYLNEPQKRKELAREARAVVDQRFSYDSIAYRAEQLMRDVMTQSTRGAQDSNKSAEPRIS